VLDRELSRYSAMSLADDEEPGGLVAPAPEVADSAETKEAEAARRSRLAQELDERGITPVYDPTPEQRQGCKDVSYDVASIDPADMKSFLLNPAPKHAGMIECRIVRERTGLNKLYPKYVMETDAGIFLLTAKKQKHNKTSNYAVSMSKNEAATKETDGFLGKLRSNFLGLEFVAYGSGLNPAKIDKSMSQIHAVQLARQELLGVQYSSSLWGGSKPRGPRKMGVVIPKVQANGERLICRTLNPDAEGLLALQKNSTKSPLIEQFHNKPPKWNEQIGAFVLNFNKRVTQASVKNFQLTTDDDPDMVFLQFGRVGKDVFNIDFRFPFSPMQAFSICLSSFDYKLCCE
jgi:tubby-related protein 1